MSQRIAYVYFMDDKPQQIAEQIAAHIDYWKTAELSNYEGGPFSDHSGGLILFDAEDLESAQQIVEQDPFQKYQLLHCHRLKMWLPE